MKQIVYRLYSNPKNEKLFSWIKLISITGGAQVIVQAVGFVCGILVIRLLPTQEYALYTLANTMLGTIILLSDGGISTGVMSMGGKVWSNKEKLGEVLITGLSIRKKFAIGSLFVSTPFLLYLLLNHGAHWITALLIVASLVPAFYAALSDSLLEIAPKLHQNILPLQKNEVHVGIGRLVLTGLTLFVFPWTFVAILAAGIPRIYGNLKLRKISSVFADMKQPANNEIKMEILGVVKKVLPGAIYYCISGQITIWIISIFGNTSSIAQIGALGRFAVVLTLLGTVISTLIIPRFARLKSDPKILFKYFCFCMLVLILTCGCILLLFKLLSAQALWILGKDYATLNNQLILNITGGCVGLITGFTFTLCSSRGWLLNPFIYISLSLISIIVGILIFDVSTLEGVLLFNIFTSLIHAFVYLTYSFYKIYKMKKSVILHKG